MARPPKETVTTAFSFDATGIDPAQTQEKIPDGWYAVEIESGEIKATNGKFAGARASFCFVILGPDHKGRKFWSGMNVQHGDPQTQEIGQRELSAVCHATNIIRFDDFTQFAGAKLMVKVGHGKGDYEAKNEAKGFRAFKPEELVEFGISRTPAVAEFVPQAPATIMPPPPIAPPAPPAQPVADPFPPIGWLAHPTAPGYYYNGSECLTEADLKARFAAVVAQSAPAAPLSPAPPTAPLTGPPVVAGSVPPWGRPPGQ